MVEAWQKIAISSLQLPKILKKKYLKTSRRHGYEPNHTRPITSMKTRPCKFISIENFQNLFSISNGIFRFHTGLYIETRTFRFN